MEVGQECHREKGEDAPGMQLQPSLPSGTEPFPRGDHKRTSVAERSLQPSGEERWMVESLQ